MVPWIVRPPTRAFAAGFFAVVALGTAALLMPFLLPPSRQVAIAQTLLAAALAYGWAWLLYPRRPAELYGAPCGVVVALLAHFSFMAILLASGNREAWLMLVGFVWTPFPWLVPIAGAAAGGTNLRNLRTRISSSVAIARLVWATCIAIVRDTYARLDRRAADPSASTIMTTVVSSCLLLAGGALGLAWLHPQVALADEGIDLSLRLLPGTVALILALAGWMAGRALLAAAPAAYRLRILLLAALLTGVATVRFWSNVAA